jgi:hypothetical protein
MLWLWIAALGLVAAATASFLWSMGRQPVAPPPSAAEAQQPSEPNAASAEDAREKTQRSKPKPATSPAGPDKRVLELAPPAPEAPVEGSAQGASTSPARAGTATPSVDPNAAANAPAAVVEEPGALPQKAHDAGAPSAPEPAP